VHGFLKENELEHALAQAPKSLVYANSWAVDFDLKACTSQLEEKADEPKTQDHLTAPAAKAKTEAQCDLPEEDEYVFTL
jgi:hypothetical protein